MLSRLRQISIKSKEIGLLRTYSIMQEKFLSNNFGLIKLFKEFFC